LDQAVKLEDLERAAKEGDLARYIIPLERLLPELPSVTILPILEKRVRHGSKFNVQIAQIQPGHPSAAQGATTELNSEEWKPARLRVFSQQERLIAIAEAVVPRTYQPVVVLEAEA
jgi:tRNA U55 pseudouridine synthase TruB